MWPIFGILTSTTTSSQSELDRFGLIGFYGISTDVGYLMSNTIHSYILDIKDLAWFGWVLWHINNCRLFNVNSLYIKYIFLKHIVDNIFKRTWADYFCTQLNGFTYFYLILIILFTYY